MNEHMKIWNWFGKAVLLCAGLGFVLGGCAAQKPETASRKSELSEVKIPSLEEFTTVGKPTKTIQTPNGSVEIYDPAQDSAFIAAFSIYRKSGYSFDEEQILNKRYRNNFGRRVILDHARAGCKVMTDSICQNHATYLFEKDCGDAHNFTKLELSKCETDNYRILLPPGAVGIENCELNGQIHRSQAHKDAPDLASSIKLYTETECKVWNKKYFKGE